MKDEWYFQHGICSRDSLNIMVCNIYMLKHMKHHALDEQAKGRRGYTLNYQDLTKEVLNT